MAPPASAYVIGESLVDVVGAAVHPGGSAANVAIGLSRLGVGTTFHTRVGRDAHGRLILRALADAGVSLTPSSLGDHPTSVAAAVIDGDGAAEYTFHMNWDIAHAPARGYGIVHAGSIGAALEPGADVVERMILEAADEGTLVSFDPNVRSVLFGERDSARERVERFVAASSVVKASDDDIAWLYPSLCVESVLQRWQGLGPRLVVATRGVAGADCILDGEAHHVAAPKAHVADTIGAGDSFMAGLLAAVLTHGFDDITDSLAFAARCAAITVSRPGADPPWKNEVELRLSGELP